MPAPEKLRQRAESRLSGIIMKAVPNLAPENVQALVHELRVHQIELELQCQELQQAQAEAEESRNTYRELYESIPIGYMTVTVLGDLVDINPAGRSLLKIPDGPQRPHHFFSLFNKADVLRATRWCCAVEAGQNPGPCELPMKRCDGASFMAALHGVPAGTGDNHEGRLRVAVEDITERKQAEAALREHQLKLEASRAELQVLAERLLTAQEVERKRISMDIHDDHCQRITALILEARSLVKQCHLHAPFIETRIAAMSDKLSGILGDFKNLSHDLHPRHLDTLTFADSVRQLIDEYSDRAGFGIELNVGNVPQHPPSGVSTCLYRLLQECLSNIQKHAQATGVMVTLAGRGENIELLVRDNGTGFNPGSVGEGRNGIGLLSMHERVRPFGGTVLIHSAPGEGTAVTASIPISLSKAA